MSHKLVNKSQLIDYHKQFCYRPKICNIRKMVNTGNYNLCMDELMSPLKSIIKTFVNSTFKQRESLIILVSIDPESTTILDFLVNNIKKNIIIISQQKKLIGIAKDHSKPYIYLPSTFSPYTSYGLVLRSILFLINPFYCYKLAKTCNPKRLDTNKMRIQGYTIAKKLRKKIPIIFCSKRNEFIARLWETKFNYLSKKPAIVMTNLELDIHYKNMFKKCKKKFVFIFIYSDDNKNEKLSQIKDHLKSIKCTTFEHTLEYNLSGVFRSILFCNWLNYYVNI